MTNNGRRDATGKRPRRSFSGVRTRLTVLLLVLSFIVSVGGTLAYFTNRLTFDQNIKTTTFSTDGYALETSYQDIPYIATEDVIVTITERNAREDEVESVISMTVKWESPDPDCEIFGNVDETKNATLTIAGKQITEYTVSQDQSTITFDLPAHVLEAGAANSTRDLLIHIPDSLMGTGQISVTFDHVTLEQSPVGFYGEILGSELTEHNFTVNVGWAASSIPEDNGKALMGYLRAAGEGKYTIEYVLAMGYPSSGMTDFTSPTASRWSTYKDDVIGLDFTEGVTSIGDYCFADFDYVTSVTFPSSVVDIGKSAFESSGLTGELVIPATVTSIQSLAFGNLPAVTTFTFQHTSDTLTLPDNTSEGNENKGAFYVPTHVDTVVNSTVPEIMYGYRWHDGADNRRTAPVLAADDRWQYTTYWGDTGDYSYETPIDLDKLTTIEIASYYIPDGTETSWDVSDPSVPGTVTAYLNKEKTKVIIAGNGYGSIFANEYSNSTFYHQPNYYSFPELTRIEGAEFLDVSNVVEACDMFACNPKLEYVNVSNWDTGNIKYTATDYNGMFSGCYELAELDVSKWDTSSMVDMTRMFDCCRSLTTLDVSKWNTSACESMMDMFSYCAGLTEIDVNTKKVNAGTVDEYTAWDVSKVENVAGMFDGTTSLKTVNMKDWYTANISSMFRMFNESGIESIDLSGWNESKVTNVDSMFQFCANLKDINLDGWNLSYVTNSDSMLRYCTALESLTLPRSLVNYGAFFADNCTSLTTIEFLHEADTEITFADARGGYGGAFPLEDPYSAVNPLRTKVIAVNTDVLDYGWTNDFRGFTVSVDSAIGGGVTASPTLSINGKSISLTPTANTGYSYTGSTLKWSENGIAKRETLGKDVRAFQMPAADVTVTPSFEVVTYNISYELAGGTVTPANPATYNVTTGTFTLTNPTKDGYTFLGWTGSNGGTPQTTVTISQGTTGNKSYTANWRADLQSISVANQPTKTEYKPGDNFESAGMTVRATYTDGTFKTITGYTIENGTSLVAGQTSVMISYTEGGVTCTTEVAIEVTPMSTLHITNLSDAYFDFSFDGSTQRVPAGESASIEVLQGSQVEFLGNGGQPFPYGGSLELYLDNVRDTDAWSFCIPYLLDVTSPSYTIDILNLYREVEYDPGKIIYDLYGVKMYINSDSGAGGSGDDQTAYAISYDLAGGTVAGTNPTSYTKATTSFRLINPTKDGYTFLGWTGSNGNSPEKYVYIFRGTTGNLSYTANWQVDTYSIKYVLAGGTLTNPVSSYTVESAAISLPTPTQAGYTFNGWYTSSDFSGNAVTEIPQGSAGNKIFYAKWTPINYSIRYELNGGAQGSNPVASYNIATSTFSLPTPTKTDLYFAGWYTTPDFTGEAVFEVVKGSTGDKTFYAKWILPPQNITYDLAGGKVATANPTTYYADTETFTLNNPTKAGYTFTGWTGSNGGTPQTTVTIAKGSTGDRTYTANWTPTVYNITYKLGGGTLDGAPATYTVESPKITLPTPTKYNRTFLGWYTNAEFTGSAVTNIAAGSTGDKTFYAKWQTPPAYAMLYSDGTLVFQYGDTPDASHGNLVNSYTGFDTATYNSSSAVPWSQDVASVKQVIFAEDIQPSSTAYWFYNMSNCTSMDLEKLDTSRVKNMANMFYNCASLTSLDLSNFDTSNVTGMSKMFYGCAGLQSLDLSSFDTAKVTNMSYMFRGCTGLQSLNVSNFNTSNVTNMSQMFTSCSGLQSLDVSSFDTGKVTNMSQMFYDCTGLQSLNVSNFNTASATNMSYMFCNCDNLTTLDLSNFNTAQVTNMAGMFMNSSGLQNLNVSSFDTAKVTDMSYMFGSCPALLSLDVSSFDTSEVANMSYMFYNCAALPSLDLSNFDTAKVTNMSYMFYSSTGLQSLNVSSFDTANVTNMYGMFANCINLASLDLSSFNTAKVTDMSYMFYQCHNTKTIYASELWSTAAVTSDGNMFKTCLVLVGDIPFDSAYIDKTYAKISGGYLTYKPAGSALYTITYDLDGGTLATTNPPVYHAGSETFTLINPTKSGFSFAGWTGSNGSTPQISVTIAQGSAGNKTYKANWAPAPVAMLYEDGTLVFQIGLEPDPAHGSLVKTYTGFDTTASVPWYADRASVKSVVVADPIHPTSTAQWFYNMSNCTSMDLAKLDTSNVTNMYGMFANCTSLTNLDVSHFNTANVTNMSYMFTNCSGIQNLNVSSFNTGKVTDMSYMFYGSKGLQSLDLSNFTTANVTNMKAMFSGCSGLQNLNVSSFNTGKVTDMSSMFNGCSGLTGLNLSHFNTANVTDMSQMFYGCGNLQSLNVDNFNTSKVTNMQAMFRGCSDLASLNVSSFNTGKVTDMSYMFYGDSSLQSLDLSNFNTANVTNMRAMFYGCTGLESLNVSNFNTGKVTDMYYMFTNCSSLETLDLSSFDTRNVTDMGYMFYGCKGLESLDLSNFNTGKVTNMQAMFFDCSGLKTLNVSNFNTANVADMSYMFTNCGGLAYLDLSSFNTSKVTDMTYMFFNCSNTKTIWASELWSTGAVTEHSNMFKGCLVLVGDIPYDAAYVDKTYAKTTDGYLTYKKAGTPLYTITYELDGGAMVTANPPVYHEGSADFTLGNPTKAGFTFTGWTGSNGSTPQKTVTITKGTTGDLSFTANWRPGPAALLYSDGTMVFQLGLEPDPAYGTLVQSYGVPEDSVGVPWLNERESVKRVVVADTIQPVSTAYWFYGMSNCTSMDLAKLDTSKVTDMSGMFYGCGRLTSLNISHFNTAQVTDMSNMFGSCSGLTSLNVGSFNTAKVTNMNSMFANCSGLTSLNVSSFVTDKVTDMSYMFARCFALQSLDLSRFNTANVTNMQSMFNACVFLTSLDLSSFNTANVTDMSYMFGSCTGLTSLNISSFNTANVTNMRAMFNGISVTSLNLSHFNTAKVTDMSNMFDSCDNLRSLNISSFNTANVTDMYGMFTGCSGLKDLNLSNFNTAKVTDMSYMFYECMGVQSLNVTSFNTSNVTNMSHMFHLGTVADDFIVNGVVTPGVVIGCLIETLDLSSFDTSKVSNMDSMFATCTEMRTIYVSDRWSSASLTSHTDMFEHCNDLTGNISFFGGYLTYKAAP